MKPIKAITSRVWSLEFFTSYFAMKDLDMNPEPDLQLFSGHPGTLPGSKTAESPSVPASEPDRKLSDLI